MLPTLNFTALAVRTHICTSSKHENPVLVVRIHDNPVLVVRKHENPVLVVKILVVRKLVVKIHYSTRTAEKESFPSPLNPPRTFSPLHPLNHPQKHHPQQKHSPKHNATRRKKKRKNNKKNHPNITPPGDRKGK